MQDPIPGSVVIKCLDGAVIEHPYVLMQCFQYFRVYYNTSMSTPENPTVEVRCKTMRVLLWMLFHRRMGVQYLDTVQFSDIVEIYRCAEFLVVDRKLHELLYELIITAQGVYDEDITDIVIPYISEYSNLDRKKLMSFTSVGGIIKMLKNETSTQYVEPFLSEIDSSKLYEIWKSESIIIYGENLHIYFTADDFIKCYELLINSMSKLNWKLFDKIIRIMKGCNHLRNKTELCGYWSFINRITA